MGRCDCAALFRARGVFGRKRFSLARKRHTPRSMLTVGIDQALDLAKVVSGTVDPSRHTLFSVMKDEMGFLPAWLAHHRALGFSQFVIFDDASEDGTHDYLRAQSDVVVLASDQVSFGTVLRYTDPEGLVREERAGTYFKIALPHVLLAGTYVCYLDADEFFILPPGVAHIGEVIDRLERTGAPSCIASVVEFFPDATAAFDTPMPQSFDGLIAAYPFFQAEALVSLRDGAQPDMIGESKTYRLFKGYDVVPKVERKGLQKIWMSSKAKKAQAFQKSARHKTPVILRNAQSRLTGSHAGNLSPSSEVLLTLAHFVFTAQFAEKIARARTWAAHANGAAKYRYYAELLDKMDGQPRGFLDEHSVRYSGPQQLINLGLMRW